MSEQPLPPPVPVNLEATWNTPLKAVVCPHCDWQYLVPEATSPARCPHCFQADLAPLESGAAYLPYQHPPELVLAFDVSSEELNRGVETFANGIPFAPRDLDAETLRTRLTPIYVPMWLVDSDIVATWSAEMGFDYNVVSHQERYSDAGGWKSHEVEETRARWEPRVGRLTRQYNNITAPALEDHAALQAALGRYNFKTAHAYTPQAIRAETLVRLPDRDPEAAWPDAVPEFQKAAGEECRRAASADHVRKFKWSPTYTNQNWTLLLLPVYATYYLDDDEQPQAVLINGQSGQMHGARRASMRRAQRTAMIIVLIAAFLFALGLCLGLVTAVAGPLALIGVLVAGVSLLVGAGALIPIIIVWRFNRRVEKKT